MDWNTSVETKVGFFLDLLSCGGSYYLHAYSPDGSLLSSNCPYPMLQEVFARSGCLKELLEYACGNTLPMVLAGPMDMLWCAAFSRQEENIERIFVIGPVTTIVPSEIDLDGELRRWGFPADWKEAFSRLLPDLPYAKLLNFLSHGLMLHYCLTGCKASVSDIYYHAVQGAAAAEKKKKSWFGDRQQIWYAEERSLHAVRTGDIFFKPTVDDSIAIGRRIWLLSHTELEMAQLNAVISISQYVREAVSAGIPPERAYAFGDLYIQSAMDSKTLAEITSAGKEMLEGLIQMVHRHRAERGYSKEIESCCDYMDLHPEEDITLPVLAQRVGYSKYYLSRRFKAEVGCTVRDYLKRSRIERAKLLLSTTDDSTQDIAEQLRFGTRSTFAECFKEMTGTPPNTYRAQHRPV